MALVIEVILCLLHRFFMLLFELFNFFGVFLMKCFNLVSNLLVPTQLEVYLQLMILFQALNFLAVFLLFALELVSQLLVFLCWVGDVWILYLLVCLECYLVFFFQGFYLLPVDDIQFLLLELQLFLGSQYLELQFFYGLVLLLDSIYSFEIKIVCTLSYSLSVFRFDQAISVFFLFSHWV